MSSSMTMGSNRYQFQQAPQEVRDSRATQNNSKITNSHLFSPVPGKVSLRQSADQRILSREHNNQTEVNGANKNLIHSSSKHMIQYNSHDRSRHHLPQIYRSIQVSPQGLDSRNQHMSFLHQNKQTENGMDSMRLSFKQQKDEGVRFRKQNDQSSMAEDYSIANGSPNQSPLRQPRSKFLPELRKKAQLTLDRSVKDLQVISTKKNEASLRLKIIQTIKECKEPVIYLTNHQLRYSTCEQLLTVMHQAKVDVVQHRAATKIRACWLGSVCSRAYLLLQRSVSKIQKWWRRYISIKRIIQIGNVKTTKGAVLVQRYMRGYKARHQIEHELARARMALKLSTMHNHFSSVKIEVLINLQIKLAYLYRSAKRRELKRLEMVEKLKKQTTKKPKKEEKPRGDFFLETERRKYERQQEMEEQARMNLERQQQTQQINTGLQTPRANNNPYSQHQNNNNNQVANNAFASRAGQSQQSGNTH